MAQATSGEVVVRAAVARPDAFAGHMRSGGRGRTPEEKEAVAGAREETPCSLASNDPGRHAHTLVAPL